MPHKIVATFIIIYTLIQQCRSSLFLSSINAANQQVQKITDYTFQVARFSAPNPIPANSNIQLIFPSQYSSNTINSCQPVNWVGVTNLVCSYSSLKLTVTGGFPTDSSLTQFTFKVNSVKNPFPSKQYTFSIRIKYPNGTVQLGDSDGVLTIQPGQATCSLKSVSGSVFQMGQITVSYASQYITAGDPNYVLLLNMNKNYLSDPLANDISADITNVPKTYIDAYLFQLEVVNQIVISMLLPPSTNPETNFIYILSQNIQGQNVDSCYITISGVTPNQFNKLQFSLATVQIFSNIIVTFASNTPLVPTDKLKINFQDTQFNISQVQSSVLFSRGISGQRTINRTSSIISVTNFVAVASQNVQYAFMIRNIKMPDSIKMQQLLVTLETSVDAIRDQQYYEYTTLPGQITNLQYSCITSQIGYTTTCYLSFTLASQMKSDGYIQISYPVGFSIQNSVLSCDASGVNIKTSPTCQGFQLTNSYKISSIVADGVAIIKGTAVNITLRSLVNPSDPRGYELTVNTYTSLNNKIDQGKVTFNVIKRALTDFSISSTVIITDTSTDYKARFNLPLNLGYPYILTMYFPFPVRSSIAVDSNLLGSSYDQPNKILTINSISSNQMTITGFKTYSSTQPVTLSGNISYNNVIYYFFNAFDLAVTQPKQMTSTSVTQSNDIVNKVFIATFTMTGLLVNDQILFNTLHYSSTQSDCSSNSQCLSNGRVKVLGVDNLGTNLTEIKINLVNAKSISTFTSLVIVYDSSGNYKKQQKQYTFNTGTPNIITIVAEQTDPYYSQNSTYTFNVTMSTQSPNSLVVDIPNTFTINSFSCLLGCTTAPFKNLNTVTYLVASNQVRIRLNLQNPADFQTSIQMKSLNSLNQEMDQGSYTPVHPCTAPCRSCSTTNHSFCLSCYKHQNFDSLDEGQCKAQCPDGKFLRQSTSSCQPCSNKCLTCVTTTNTCSYPCNTSYYFYDTNSSCLSDCPTGFYKQSNFRCVICQLNCLQCSSGTVCTKCNSNTFLYQESCQAFCDPSTYINIDPRKCIDCPASCQSCTASQCLSCKQNFYLFDKGCIAECPSGYFIESSKCAVCQSPCSTCFLNSNNCTSCLPVVNSIRYYYLQNVCYQNCPDGYYTSLASNTCLPCNSKCKTCTSATQCLSCNANFKFHQKQCLQACPVLGFYDNNNICSACSFPCASCSSATVCLSCSGQYYWYETKCETTCLPGLFANKLTNTCDLCTPPCSLCSGSSTHCLACTTQNYFNNSCVSSCSNGYYSTNNLVNGGLICSLCKSPCFTCTTTADTCQSCVASHAFYLGQCIATCPIGMYKFDQTCRQCPDLCQTCELKNLEVRCSACLNTSLLYGYQCVQTCPTSTTASSPYCISQQCSGLSNCLSCSNLRCLSCQTNYTLNTTQQKCDIDVVEQPGKTITSVSELPVPFPFLIALAVIIILAFLIRIEFQKMFIVIFIYSLAGIAEVGGFGLWIALIYTRGTLNTEESLISTEGQAYYLKLAATILCCVYAAFNLVGVILYCVIARSDRKYIVWERQDNLCAVFFITLIAFFLSFRFNLIKFSKLGNLHYFSAPLSADSKISHVTILAYLSILLISLPAIGIAGYITYLQITMNYLFFTSIQVAIIGVIMIILSILQALIPKKYTIQKKQEYKQGYASDGVEGQSLDEVLAVDIGNQQYFYGKQVVSDQGDVVRGGNTGQFDDNQDYEFYTNGQSTSEPFRNLKNTLIEKTRELAANDELDELDDILVQAEKLAVKLNQPSRPFGTIRKQQVRQLLSNSSDSQSIGSLQQSDDDEPPPIDMPHQSNRRKYIRKQFQVLDYQQQNQDMDINQLNNQIEAGLEFQQRKKGMGRLKQLFKEVEEQEKQERGLRERLNKLTQKQKQIKSQQYEKARELVERNQMSIEDQLTRINRMFEVRAKKQAERARKLKQLEQKRRKSREQRKKEIESKQNFEIDIPSQNKDTQDREDNQDIDEDVTGNRVLKIKVRSKNYPIIEIEQQQNIYIDKQIPQSSDQGSEVNTGDENWIQKQKQVNFIPETWQMQQQQKLSPNPRKKTTNNQDISEQQDPDGNSLYEVQTIHWPIDPQLQQKIKQVQDRAQMYIKRKKKKSATNQIQEIDTQILSGDFDDNSITNQKLIYQDEQGEQSQEIDKLHQQFTLNKNILVSGQKIKIPKGRVNRNVIDLSPNP